jgi:hypothetical protein
MLIFTRSPTSQPPASSATFQFSPKSFRLNEVAALKALALLALHILDLAVDTCPVRQTCYVTNGEIACDRKVILAKLTFVPRAIGEVGDIEEVRRTEMTVALVVAGIDAGGLEGDVDDRRLEILAVDGDLAIKGLEAALHIGNHHVLGDELDGGMRWIKLPGGHAALSFSH